jgi:hypothetical protein
VSRDGIAIFASMVLYRRHYLKWSRYCGAASSQ